MPPPAVLGATLACSFGMAPGTLALIDGSGIVAGNDTIELRSSTQTSLLMSSTPNMSSAVPTPAQMVSMWQSNSIAYLAEASFGAQVLRDDAVALVTNIAWGG